MEKNIFRQNNIHIIPDWQDFYPLEFEITDPRIIYDGAPAPDEDPADYIRRPISAVKIG